jgi:hypothetical protein
MDTKRIVNIRTEVVKGKLVKTVIYSDGTTQKGIVSEQQIDRMLDRIKSTPDLTVVKKTKQAGRGSILVIGALAIVAAILTGCVEDDRCTRPGWHRYDDCYGEP